VKFKVGRMMRERVCDEPAPPSKSEKPKVQAKPEAPVRRPTPQPPSSNSPF